MNKLEKSSSLFLFGTSHQVANLEERELIGLPNDSITTFSQGLHDLPGLKEFLVLNTCNRTEIYGAFEDPFDIEDLASYFSRFRNISPSFLEEKLTADLALKLSGISLKLHLELILKWWEKLKFSVN